MWFTFLRSTFLKLQIGAIERELGEGAYFRMCVIVNLTTFKGGARRFTFLRRKKLRQVLQASSGEEGEGLF